MSKFVGDPIEYTIKHMYLGGNQDFFAWLAAGRPEDMCIPYDSEGKPDLSQRTPMRIAHDKSLGRP